ncbi:dihydrolipoyl dehydrogenase [Mycoplasma sp. 1012]
MKKFDVVVLGGGPGGYSLASILATNGKNVALIEKSDLGGTCVNRGCISTKTLIKSAKVYETVKKAKEFGIHLNGKHFHLNEIQKRRKDNKELLNTNIEKLLVSSNVTIFKEYGEVLSNKTIKLTNETIEFDKLVLATGSSSRKLNLKGFEQGYQEGFLIDSDKALTLEKLPESMTIVGSGPISLEFAYFYSTLGVKITILEVRSFMGNFDIELQKNVKNYLLEKGVAIYENVKLLEVKDKTLLVEIDSKIQEFSDDLVLMAVGRVANTESFSKLNLELTPTGFVKVNDKMETSVKNVYAIGDVTGILLLSTTAYKTGDIVAKELLNKKHNEVVNPKFIPWSVYLNPEFAGVGSSEQQLINSNVEYASLVLPAAALPRVHADGLDKKHGFVKFLIDKKTNKILGSFMFLEGAHILINEIAHAIQNDWTFTDLQTKSYTHPTIAEAVYYAARNFTFKK